MRTNLPGIDGRVTLYEIEDINFSGSNVADDEAIEDNIFWKKCAEIESFVKQPQQVFQSKKRDILVVKVDENYFALNDKCPHAYLEFKGE